MKRFAFLLLVLCSHAAAQAPAQPPLVKEGKTVKISEHVFVIPDELAPMVPNVGIVVGKRATLVVDPGMGARSGEIVAREAAKLGRNTELYIVNTHFHPEHTTGEAGFPPSAKIIRATAQQQDIDEMGMQWVQNFASRSPAIAEVLQGFTGFRKPDGLFDKETIIDLGGVSVRLVRLGPGHTRGDTVFFVEQDRVLFSGDLVMSQLYPAFATPQSRVASWLASLDALDALRAQRLVPAHGALADSSAIGRYRDYLTALRARVAELKRAGRSADEAAETVRAEFPPRYPDWGQPLRVVAAANGNLRGAAVAMKAAFFRRHGGPEVLEYGEAPDPAPGAGEVLVDVHAASVNAADWKMRAGSYAPVERFPYVPGRDFSGVVAALGEGVKDLKAGDPVFGVCEVSQEGAYAEKIAIKAAIVARKPDALSHAECAALALAGLTAVVSLEDTLQLARGETILIQGGAGGVAGFAIQLAKHIGARVVTTASAANHAYVRSLGADEVIDYRTEDFTRRVSGCDAVFDTVGDDVALKSFAVLRPGGRAAFIASGASAPASPRPDVRAYRPKVGRDRRHLERIVALVRSGAVRVPEIRRYPLSEAAAAHALSEGRHFRGKLVLEVRPG